MSIGTPQQLTPPLAPTVEIQPVQFDFGPLLISNYPPGTTITAVDSVTCSVSTGSSAVDPTPQSRVIGSPVIVPSQSEPTILTGAVAAWFGTMVDGVSYVLQVVVSLSDGRSHPSLEVGIACYDPSGL